jgi:cytochrome c biogenesis protein CcdA
VSHDKVRYNRGAEQRKRAVTVRALMAAFMILTVLLTALPSSAEGAVHLYYFSDPRCSVCHEIQDTVLASLKADYGDRLIIEERNIAEADSFELMLTLEAQYDVVAGSIPEIFIGDYALVGEEEIRDHLRERVESHLAQGGVSLPVVEGVAAPEAPAEATPAAPPVVPSDAVVRAVMLSSDTCPACTVTRQQVLPGIMERFGPQLRLRIVDVTAGKNQDVWDALVSALEVPRDRWFIPMLMVGDQVFVGGQEIADDFPKAVEAYLAQGGVDYPHAPGVNYAAHALFSVAPSEPVSTPEPAQIGDTVQEPAPLIHAAYFYQAGCDECDRAEHDLNFIMDKYPQVRIQRFDVRREAALNEYLSARASVAERQRLTAPALFIGTGALVGEQVRVPAIEALLTPYLATGAEEPWTGWEEERDAVQESIVERFSSFGLLTVVGAGLLDGVNPCAFATMIFLISYLTMRKRTGKALLATGAAFTLGVFLTYLGVGFGFLRFLSSLPFLDIIGKWIYGLTAVLCLALAWGSYVDYRRARQGRLEDMSLKLPERLRDWSKTLIREGTGAKRFVLSSFALGFGVSLVELACTGQVYLPTIIFVLGVPEWRGYAGLLLLVYNIMFILPLVGVFVLVYYGTSSEQLIEWMNKHAATVKLGMAALFLLLAGWLGYSILSTLRIV